MKLRLSSMLAAGALWLWASTGLAASFISKPAIEGNPNPAVPLAAIITFSASEPVCTDVIVNDGQKQWTISFDATHDPSKGLPIVGMKADRQHSFTITITGKDGKKVAAPERLTWRTPPLPPVGYEFPPIQVLTAKPESMEPGFTILSVRRGALGRSNWLSKAQMAFARRWGMLVGLDNQGEVVWYYKSDTRIAGVERLRNGNLLFHLQDFRTREIDFLGNIVNEWYAENRPQGKPANPKAIPVKGLISLHHQPHEMPNGNFLAMSAHPKLIRNYPTSVTDPQAPRKDMWVMGDVIVEFDRQGNVVWSWDSFDHLDPYRVGYGAFDSYWHTRGFKEHVDWTHGNGVTYDPRDDSVIMSLRHQDAIIKVDRKTGEIRWILGPHKAWNEKLAKKLLKPVGKDFRWPWHGHNPRVTETGTIVMYDNATQQAWPFDPPASPDTLFSRGVEFEVNEKDMTVRQRWASSRSFDEEDARFSWAMGDAHRLPKTRNHMVVDAIVSVKMPGLTLDDYDFSKRHVDDLFTYARIREFQKDTKKVLFEVHFRDPHEAIYWQVFGGVRIPGFYTQH